MEYITVTEAAKKWGVSNRMVQKYCAEGETHRFQSVFLRGRGAPGAYAADEPSVSTWKVFGIY